MARITPYVLTGFLGSGKTTLLHRLLRNPAFHDTAVIVNELGEIALDHDLLSFSAESTVVMPGGCVCCSIRDDIEKGLRELFAARDAGRIPEFSRIIIETTGIADPIPLLMTLQVNPLARSRLARPVVITVVDRVLGSDTLTAHREAQVQVSNADVILLSKSDLSSGDSVTALTQRLATLNPWAPVHPVNLLTDALERLFSAAEPVAWPSTEVTASLQNPGYPRVGSRHDGIVSHCLSFERPLDWTGFAVWMSLLLHRHGSQILRIKGLLDIDGLRGPTVFHSAQHLVHPPSHLDSWPGEVRRSRLVLITRDMDPLLIESSLLAFDRAAKCAIARPAERRAVGGGGSIAGRPIRRPSAPGWIKG